MGKGKTELEKTREKHFKMGKHHMEIVVDTYQLIEHTKGTGDMGTNVHGCIETVHGSIEGALHNIKLNLITAANHNCVGKNVHKIVVYLQESEDELCLHA